MLAGDQVRAKEKQYNLTGDQRSQLKEKMDTERAAAEAALPSLYTEVWLPQQANCAIGIEKVQVGGRPLQVRLDAKKQAMIHERVMELLAGLQKRVFGKVQPSKIVELFSRAF